MLIDDFKSLISTFSDPGSETLFEKSNIMFSLNGEIVEITITARNFGNIFVDEGNTGHFVDATQWIIKRLANLQLLASRLKENIKPTPNFVSPIARVLQSLESSADETSTPTSDALNSTFQVLRNRSPFETSVLYITSDAGEGKTSLINEMARQQAEKFSRNEAEWLLVPIPLGGRHFLRFDDITVGALQNRYRFPFLYYNSFLALVRMGVIVPVFDGFEEMFVENSSGEALSAMGILVAALNSTGALVIAARKAYFEFENLKMQEKLFDSISSFAVGFGKVELCRWEKEQFIEYCKKRKITNPNEIYERVSNRLGVDHSLLTRPVLVNKLIDIAAESKTLESFLDRLQGSGGDYFSVFVKGIIEREATEKWIDRSGDVGIPLLTTDEHCELLSLIAVSMWEARVDYLKRDLLEFTSDYYCETTKKTPFQTQQIRERLRGHALLVSSTNAQSAVEFDHDEFRLFFLGEGFAAQISSLNDRAKTEALGLLRRGILPEQSQEAFLHAISRKDASDYLSITKFFLDVAALDGQASYTHENCANLIIKLINKQSLGPLDIKNLTFAADILKDKNLAGINFINCYFSPTSLEETSLINCHFTECTFGQLKFFKSTSINNCEFNNCTVETLRLVEQSLDFWDPTEVEMQLKSLGALTLTQDDIFGEMDIGFDDELKHFEKLLRYFMRSTHISESVILIKLGENGKSFIDKSLPKLLSKDIMAEIENRGGPLQRRFKLNKSLEKLNHAVSTAQGSFEKFLKNF